MYYGAKTQQINDELEHQAESRALKIAELGLHNSGQARHIALTGYRTVADEHGGSLDPSVRASYLYDIKKRIVKMGVPENVASILIDYQSDTEP